MPFFRLSKIAALLLPFGFFLGTAAGQETRQPQAPPQESPVKYDPAIFQKRIPAGDLAFLNSFAGAPAGDLVRDKQFRKLMHIVIPDCMYHYGRDMPLYDALEMVLNKSPLPVIVRGGRYLLVAGYSGPYLRGRGFLWIDLEDGIALGGFFFRPTNGEPTPTVTVFSRQVKEDYLRLSQLPPEFAADLTQWSWKAGVPPVTTRYFIGASNKRLLLEHDEDYCAANPPNVCDQMNADAADVDMNAAYYLEQVDYATNATAWMIVGPDQIAWVQVRNQTCSVGPYPVRCRIRMTRERTATIMHRHPVRRMGS